MNNLRWAPFLVFKDNKNYAQGYRDDTLQHDDYKAGIHISIPDRLNITTNNEFEYGGHKMKAVHVQRCTEFRDHVYVFAKEQS